MPIPRRGLAWRSLALALALLPPGRTAAAGDAPSWPEFHGTHRDNRSAETGLLKAWPPQGPPRLWASPELGKGYAPVSVAEGRLFTSGDFGDEEMLVALDLDGRPAWKVPHGRAWKGAQAGARTTPTCRDGVLYHLNPAAQLSAFDAQSGRKLWTVDLKERFDAKVGTWGFTENVVVDGDRVLCVPGGRAGRVVALDRKTGATLWANTEIADRAAYSSPLVVEHGGVRQLIALAHETVMGVDVRTGKLLWTHKHPSTCDQNVTTPIYHDGSVFVTSGHRAGGRLIRLEPDPRGARELWFGTDLDNCHGGVALLDGHLYGSGCRLYKRGLICVEWATGRTVYNAQAIGKVSITHADGRLYCLGNDASMALVEATPKAATVVGRFMPPWSNPSPCLSHPVVCGGRLYIRHLNELFAYDVRAKP